MRTATVFFIMMIAGLVCRGGAPQPEDNFEEDPYVLLCGEADRALADENYPEAAARLRDAISLKPHSASNILLISNLGLVYALMDRDSLALATLDEGLRDFPDMKTLRHNKAKVLMKTGRDKDAYREYDYILTLDSLDTEARYFHGIVALYNGDYRTAEEDFAVLESAEPRTARTAQALATLYSWTGRPREAITHYRALINDDPSPEYYAALAGCYIELENLSEASALLAEGMKKFPDDPELYYYRAWLNLERFHNEDAQKDAKRAIELGANPAKVNRLFGK